MAIQHIGQAQQKSPLFVLKLKDILERGMNAFGRFLSNYWPHILTTVLGLVVAAAFSVPVLSYMGLDVIAKPIFYSMHYICAQVPAHSFYVFGHQLGLCARNLSIYGSMFIGCLIFTLSKKRLPGIPWWFWAILILPMAWDGGTQMFGWRESTWELRAVTGILFGLANIWFVLPMIQKTLLETPGYIYTPASVPTTATYPMQPPYPVYPQQSAIVMPTVQPGTATLSGGQVIASPHSSIDTTSTIESTVTNVTPSVKIENGHGTQGETTIGVEAIE